LIRVIRKKKIEIQRIIKFPDRGGGANQTNRDPYKEEIKIPPPHPQKRKNVNYFPHSKDPYFLCPPE
jgi:hypothetical protein